MTARPRVAVVLGAGGSVGHAFHCGVLAALQDVTGFDARDADVLVGTSAGSIIATLVAGGLSGADLAAGALGRPRSEQGSRLVERLSGARTTPPLPARRSRVPLPAAPGLLARLAVRPWRARPGVVAAAALPEGQLPHREVAGHVPILFGDRWPEHVWVTAVRLDTGARVVFGREGEPAAGLADAVAASCAIPGWYRPVTVDGVRHVDGGAHSPTNLDVLAGRPFDAVVVSSPMSVGRDRRWSPDLPLRLAWGAALASERAAVEDGGATVVQVAPTADDQRAMGLQPLDRDRRHRITRQAYATASSRFRRSWVQDLLGSR